jgi:hypothetical protein
MFIYGRILHGAWLSHHNFEGFILNERHDFRIPPQTAFSGRTFTGVGSLFEQEDERTRRAGDVPAYTILFVEGALLSVE